MGQYFQLVNTTKREFLCGHDIGGVIKLWEWCANSMAGVLPYLLRKSTGGGGGDHHDPENTLCCGRWAGDRIMLLGDYDESEEGYIYDLTGYSDYPESVDGLTFTELCGLLKQLGTSVSNVTGNVSELEENQGEADIQKCRDFVKARARQWTNIAPLLVDEYNEFLGIEERNLSYGFCKMGGCMNRAHGLVEVEPGVVRALCPDHGGPPAKPREERPKEERKYLRPDIVVTHVERRPANDGEEG